MKREFKICVALVVAMGWVAAIAFGQTVSINGLRVMRGIVGTPSDGQIAVWSAASGQWVTGSALTSTAVNTNGSITIFGSVQDTGFTITNNANGSYRWSLPASGLSGNYGLNVTGTNIALASIAAGVAGADTQVQFNDGGSLAGNAGLVFNKTTHALTATGSLVGSDVNSTGSGEGVMSETNSAGTFVYREAPNATMTANVFHRNIPAAATGYYKGTVSAVTNEVDSIVATIPTTDLSGTLAAAQFPAQTGAVQNSAGSLANSLNFGGNVATDAESAGVLQFLADSATATAIALKGPDGSGTDKVGGAFIVRGGQGTGTGRGGDIKGQSAPSSTTGASANAYADRFFYSAKHVVLSEAVATTFVNITCASGKSIAGEISASVNADDGTNFQMQENHLKFAAVNKAGTITATIDTVAGTVATSSGTLTPVTFTIVANGASVDIKVAATSSLTQTTLNCEWAILSLNGNGAAAVTAQ